VPLFACWTSSARSRKSSSKPRVDHEPPPPGTQLTVSVGRAIMQQERGHSCPHRLRPRAPSGQECPMPLGFDPPHPGGMAENSPTFQRWGREFRGAQVPKGRLKPGVIHQPSLRDLSGYGRWFPTLKRWAIIGCPSGTKTCPGLAYFVGANPSGIGQECPRSDSVSCAPPPVLYPLELGLSTETLDWNSSWAQGSRVLAVLHWSWR
jgi:hypothetical protein